MRPRPWFRPPGGASTPDFRTIHYFATLCFFLLLTFLVGFLICSTPGILAAASGWELWVLMLPAFLFSWAVPMPVVITLTGSWHLVMTGAAVVIIVASFAWTLLSPKDGFLRPLVAGERRLWRLGAMESVGMAYMAVTALSVVWAMLVFAAGQTAQQPAVSWEAEHLAEALFFASVWEEASVKLTLISLPLLAAGMFGGPRLPLRRYLLGGGIEIDRLAGLLILVSAAVFGYLHVIGGWDWFKFPPAFAFGMFSGYLFLRFGLHASILLHFANNFLFAPVYFAAGASVTTALVLLFLMFVLLGLAYWLLLIRAIGRTIAGTRAATNAGSTGGGATGGGWSGMSSAEPGIHGPEGIGHGLPLEIASGDHTSHAGASMMRPPPVTVASVKWRLPEPRRARDPYACGYCGAREYRFAEGSLACVGCGARSGKRSGETSSAPPPGNPQRAEKDIMEI